MFYSKYQRSPRHSRTIQVLAFCWLDFRYCGVCVCVKRLFAVVACATFKRSIGGSSPWLGCVVLFCVVLCCVVLCCAVYGAVHLGKALHPHVYSLEPGVTGYLAGPSRLLCVIKADVYSPVPSARRYTPDFTQLLPDHRACSLISHLNSPGSIQPCCRHGAGNYSNTQKPSLSYQVPTCTCG